MISIKCDECLKSYKVKPEMAGKKAKCKCGASIQIPSLKKKQAGGSSPRRKKPQHQPEPDPWDEDPFDDDAFDDDPYADDAVDDEPEDYGRGDDYDDDDDRPRRSRRSTDRGRSRKGRGRSKKDRKRRSRDGFSPLLIAGMVFGGVAILGLLVGLVVKPIGLAAGGGIMIVCFGLSCVGSLRCMLAAFQEDVMCGVLWFFLPGYFLYYVVSRFSELSQYIMMWFGGLIGILVCAGYFALLRAM